MNAAQRPEDPRGDVGREPGEPGPPLPDPGAPGALPSAPRPGAMQRLRAWLCRKNPQLRLEALSPELDLIDSGAVDSFALVELIMLIEQECGRPVLSEDLDPRSIRTLAAIERSFFAEERT